jgi:hypothetical protein
MPSFLDTLPDVRTTTQTPHDAALVARLDHCAGRLEEAVGLLAVVLERMTDPTHPMSPWAMWGQPPPPHLRAVS